ncbi:hypothetical protein DNTS_022122 [Danionella cerebrum]|uniref:B30.2/SPRY domain-containing protein n=1 Tax=Danionella cerebrum TaxID=2873325 RepID=A0A553R0M3_9TELE|nr:hypothetical protein DNTS_022122 [Danionella translucida]
METCGEINLSEAPPWTSLLRVALDERWDLLRSIPADLRMIRPLKMFLEPMQRPMMDSQKHLGCSFRRVGGVVSSYRAELRTALKCLQVKLSQQMKMKEEFEEAAQHIKFQATHTEKQIKYKFEELRRFLREEEEAQISAVRKEEEQKMKMVKENLQRINTLISAFSLTIKDTEEILKANDTCFLKDFSTSMERVQISEPDPYFPSGALIDVSGYLGNLQFRTWKKMEYIVHHTPVILDPNTANPHLVLSDDLCSLRDTFSSRQTLPDNPERFDYFSCVLGSEGFTSGKHRWDVDVKECPIWSLGVTTASNLRKGRDFFNTNVWSVSSGLYEPPSIPLGQELERVRVDLDYDGGTVSFSDPLTKMLINTFTTTFRETLFPFFCSIYHLQILPLTDL